MATDSSIRWRAFSVDADEAEIEAAFELPIAELKVIETSGCINVRIKTRTQQLEDVLREIMDERMWIEWENGTHCKGCGAPVWRGKKTPHEPDCPIHKAQKLLEVKSE